MYIKKEFPKRFFWGTATAAFQIEGASKEDGKGESIWDRFCEVPGKILTGETGEPATDSYHLYLEDIKAMKQLGVNAYRFSIAWPRIFPQGKGQINEKGVDYYIRLVDALLENDITPFATLYHWDLPQALQDKGGWYNRDTVYAYVDYVHAIVGLLGDKVKNWFTHNEPICTAFLGNQSGEHAPGIKDTKTAVQISHNLLLSHGLAIPVIHANSKGCKAGIVLNFSPSYASTNSKSDLKAAELHHAISNTWFLDPLFGRGYPKLAVDYYGVNNPKIEAGDMQKIAVPFDLLGVNYYKRFVSHTTGGAKSGILFNYRDPKNITARDWEITPEALFELLKWLKDEYKIGDMVISENGAAYDDIKALDGRVYDPLRQEYLKEHLNAIWHAIQAGVPVNGYFCWSLLDNFEWAFGTSSRFGLVYTNFTTQERTLKESGKWYAKVAQSNKIV